MMMVIAPHERSLMSIKPGWPNLKKTSRSIRRERGEKWTQRCINHFNQREKEKGPLYNFQKTFWTSCRQFQGKNVSVKGSQMQLFTSGEEFFHWAAHTPVPNSRCVFYAGTNFASAAECLYT